jgi:hypothetical protein
MRTRPVNTDTDSAVSSNSTKAANTVRHVASVALRSYAAAAELAGWDRAAVEDDPQRWSS